MSEPKYKVGDILREEGAIWWARRFRIESIEHPSRAYMIMRLSGFAVNAKTMLVPFEWVHDGCWVREGPARKIRNPFFVRRVSV
jgi:hypothetical protein